VHRQLRRLVGSRRGRLAGPIHVAEAENRDRVRELRVLVPGANDEEPLAFEPFGGKRARHDHARHRGMRRLAAPTADEPVERLQHQVGGRLRVFT
jgi:hypothetical protein